MCSICLKNPCDNRCPNAPEPKALLICSECGTGIFEGEKFYDGYNGPVCMDCLEDMTVSELVELFGETLTIAEVV